MARPGEDELIVRYFAPLAGPGGLGLLDDAALVQAPPGREIVLTKDALVAGVHFFAGDPPDAIARKALRVNLSDLAAKGADPLGYALALALPGDWTADWLAGFARGLGEDAAAYGMPLLGGDTVKTPGPLVISVTALGSVPAGTMVRRTGVRAGDALYVTGTIGDAALGLRLRLGEQWLAGLGAAAKSHLLDRYLLPRPRNALAAVLREFATGAMDVSDGFAGDLAKMLRVSGVGARVELARVPLSDAAVEVATLDKKSLDIALAGGDDYEIICSVPEARAGDFARGARAAGVDVTRIGVAVAVAGLRFFGGDGLERVLRQGSFSHF